MYLLSWRPGRTSCARNREQCTCACFSRRPGHWSSPLLFLPSESRSLVLDSGYSEVRLELKGPQQTLITNDMRRMFKRSSEQSTLGKKIWYDSFQEYFIVTWPYGNMPCKEELKQCIFLLFSFLVFVPCKGGIRILGSRKFLLVQSGFQKLLLVQSGIQLISAVKSGILAFGNGNTAQRIRNPTNDWNPESNFHWQRIRKPGNFCWWNPESSKFLLWKPESWALELKESGISLTIGIQNSSSTNREWNPVPKIRNPRRGIQTPRLFWLPLHETKDYITNNVFFTLFLSWFYALPAIWSLAGFTTIGRTLVICTVKLLGLTVVISQCSWLKQSTP